MFNTPSSFVRVFLGFLLPYFGTYLLSLILVVESVFYDGNLLPHFAEYFAGFFGQIMVMDAGINVF